MGETSRSPYQRGAEHAKEVREAVTTHPMVIHCQEEHQGEIQPILMRILSAHMTPMDRQIQESLNIVQEIRKEGSCLNQKSEWAGVKFPDLEVKVPKGVAKTRKEGNIKEGDEEEEPDQGTEGGDKRIREMDIEGSVGDTSEENTHSR